MANITPVKNAPEADIENLDALPVVDFKAAKKAEKKARKAMRKAEGKGKGGLIIKLLIVLIIAAIIAAFWFDVLGVRDRYLTPILQRIPVVNNLLPMSEESSPYDDMTAEQLIALVESLRNQVDDREEQIQSLTDRSTLLANQVETLSHFRDQQMQFRMEKEEFDRMIVSGSPVDFARFFESIDPENAAMLYQEAISREQWTSEHASYVAMIQAMEARPAAEMFSRLIRSNPDLVASVLSSMDNRASGEILSAMPAQDAALIINRMYPEPPPAPVPFASLLPVTPPPDAPADVDDEAAEDGEGEEDAEETTEEDTED